MLRFPLFRVEPEMSGLVWLTEDERREYVTGRRVFGVHTQTLKVRVE